MRKRNTLEKWVVRALLMILLPLLIVLQIYNFYSIRQYTQEVAKANRYVLDLYRTKLEDSLTFTENYASQLIGNNFHYQLLQNETSVLSAHISAWELVRQFDETLPTQKHVAMLCVRSDANHIYRYSYQSALNSKISNNLEQKSEIYTFMTNLTEDKCDYLNWTPVAFGNAYFLVRLFYSNDGAYLGIVVDINELYQAEGKGESDSALLLYTGDGQPLNDMDYVDDRGIELRPDRETPYYYTGGSSQYMVVSQPVASTGLYMGLVTRRSTLTGINSIILLLSVAALLCVLVLPTGLIWFRRGLVAPMNNVVEVIKSIRLGNLEAKVDTDCDLEEFQVLGESFNAMMDEIHTLKLEGYEKELAKQKSEIQYLQMQIRPHFYLNCLKSLYVLSMQRSHEKAQTMILAISNHIRYTFRDNAGDIALEEELEHIKNYVQLQSNGRALTIHLLVDVDEAMKGFRLPILSLATLVENCVKHGPINKALNITVSAKLLLGEDIIYADLLVKDTGPGFTQEALDLLMEPDRLMSSDGNSIGLANVCRRVKLLYGDQATLSFYNDGGACAEIVVPYEYPQ